MIITWCCLCASYSGLSQSTEQDSTKSTAFAIYPAFGYQPETRAQVGTIAIWVFDKKEQKNNEFYRPTSISPFFLYTFRNQVISAVDGEIFFENGLNLNAVTRYFNFPDNYYGIGNDNDPDSLEKYTNRFIQLQGQLYRPLNSNLFIGGTFEIQNNWLRELEPEGRLITEEVNGLDGGLIFGIGPAIRYDSRNNTIYPTKGILASAEILLTYIGDYSYTNYTLDFRKFISIKNEKNVLGFQVSTVFSSGSNMPFYKLPQLGGDERLRGIENASLYRDRQSFYVQTEYRRDLFWRIGMVAFAGVGDVAQNIGDFRLDEFKYVAGIGGRFAAVRDQKLNIRADFGIAKGGQTAIYIGLREVF